MITLKLTEDEATAMRIALSYTIRDMAAQNEGNPGYDRMVDAVRQAKAKLDTSQR